MKTIIEIWQEPDYDCAPLCRKRYITNKPKEEWSTIINEKIEQLKIEFPSLEAKYGTLKDALFSADPKNEAEFVELFSERQEYSWTNYVNNEYYIVEIPLDSLEEI